MKGILGKKVGMTQVFTKEGKLIPVTVIEVEPNVVTQIKTVEKDGYDAIQLATDTIRESLSNKPAIGHTKKANTTPKRFLKEIRDVEDFFERNKRSPRRTQGRLRTQEKRVVINR